MGGSTEVYTSVDERTEFNYANVRKATYRGSNSIVPLFWKFRTNSYQDGLNSYQGFLEFDM